MLLTQTRCKQFHTKGTEWPSQALTLQNDVFKVIPQSFLKELDAVHGIPGAICESVPASLRTELEGWALAQCSAAHGLLGHAGRIPAHWECGLENLSGIFPFHFYCQLAEENSCLRRLVHWRVNIFGFLVAVLLGDCHPSCCWGTPCCCCSDSFWMLKS